MDHARLHNLEEGRFGDRIRPCGPYCGVNSSWIKEFVATIEEDEKVHVRQSTLLELDGVDLRYCTAEDAVLEYLM